MVSQWRVTMVSTMVLAAAAVAGAALIAAVVFFLPVGEGTLRVEINDPDIEVVIKLDGKAETASTTLFRFELEFAGIFRVRNVPQESLNPLVMIECPRLLFPFAREIIANAVRNGGFPPLLLDPVDFVSLYRQKMAQVQPAPAVGS